MRTKDMTRPFRLATRRLPSGDRLRIVPCLLLLSFGCASPAPLEPSPVPASSIEALFRSLMSEEPSARREILEEFRKAPGPWTDAILRGLEDKDRNFDY